MTEVPSHCLLDLAPPDLRAFLERSDLILIPIGSCEMHGDHLPLGTDVFNATEVCRRAAALADVPYAPPLWLGYSPQHLRQPEQGMGTITLRASTYVEVLYELAKCLIHHGFNRLIFVNGHTSNTKVTDPVMRRIRYETGALVAMFKPYGERYLGLIEDLMENPPEETPGWHASEQETSIMMAYDERLVRMDRAVSATTHAPPWMPDAFSKGDGTWDASFRGYEYFYFPMDHDEFADHGVIGNPLRATADKGNAIFDRFASHLADAIGELMTVPLQIKVREHVQKA